MTQAHRRMLLGLVLVGVVVWSGWLAVNDPAAEPEPATLVEPVTRTPELASEQPPLPATREQEAGPRLALSRTNLFPEQSWYVAPPTPPPPPSTPPPLPQAPMLPFSYLGSWQEAGQTTYYLARGDLPIQVRQEQVVDGVWRLEPVRGNTLVFTYLPLNQTRSLRTGE